jgi:hypothetical protein
LIRNPNTASLEFICRSDAAVLGSNNENLPKIIAIFAEVQRNSCMNPTKLVSIVSPGKLGGQPELGAELMYIYFFGR